MSRSLLRSSESPRPLIYSKAALVLLCSLMSVGIDDVMLHVSPTRTCSADRAMEQQAQIAHALEAVEVLLSLLGLPYLRFHSFTS
jgi:hypothetical protein